MSNLIKKDLQYYMELPYTFIVQHIKDESGEYYYSRVLELDGCQSHGDTRTDALESIREAMEGWIETKLEFNDPIPEPVSSSNYSGKFLLRLPKSLHHRLSMEAASEGVSLNQYALYKLAH